MSPKGRLAFGTFVIALIASPWEGYVISKLWAWFAVPIGAHPINWAAACGLSVLAATLLSGKEARSIEEEGWGYAVSCFTVPLMALGVGVLFRALEAVFVRG